MDMLKRWVLILGIFIAAMAYSNSLRMEFIGDDIGRIVYASALGGSLSDALRSILPDRPVLVASLWANYQIGGLDPLGYKIVNLVLHGLVALFLFLLLQKLLSPSRAPISFLCALIFFVHPLNNQAVNSISQRGVLLAAFFSLAALLVYIHNSSRWSSRGLVALLAVLAVLSKTNAMALPFIFIAFERIFNKTPWTKTFQKTWGYFLIGVLPLLFYFVFKVNEQYGTLSGWQYFAVQWRVIFTYFSLFIWPSDLHFLYAYSVDHVFQNPWTWLAAFGHLIVLALIFFAVHKKYKAIAFGLSTMYLVLLPESSVFAIRHLIFDHRAYLPLLFFLFAVGAVIQRWWEPHGSRARVIVVMGLVWALGLSVANAHYSSQIGTYKDWVFYNFSKNPDDEGFNVFNIKELYDRDPRLGLEFAQKVVEVHSSKVIYKNYLNMMTYSQKESGEKRKFLEDIYQWLTQNQEHVNYEARLNFIQFYGRSIQEFLSDSIYWENVDEFLYLQIPYLLKGRGRSADVFSIYKRNLERLTLFYRDNPPQNSWRQIRVLLSLKHDFGVSSESIENALRSWEEQASKQDKNKLEQFLNEHNKFLPLKDDAIE